MASLGGELKKMADLVSNILHQSALENGNPQKKELAKHDLPHDSCDKSFNRKAVLLSYSSKLSAWFFVR